MIENNKVITNCKNSFIGNTVISGKRSEVSKSGAAVYEYVLTLRNNRATLNM